MRRSGDHHLPVPLPVVDCGGIRGGCSLCAILAAAFAGFLIFNYHPAQDFHGRLRQSRRPVSLSRALTLAGPVPHQGGLLVRFFYPAITFAYPIFDTVLVSILRKLAGRPISIGGRDHSSHRLASLGLDQRQVVWILWLLTAFGSGLGILIYWMPGTLLAGGGLLLGFARHIRSHPGNSARLSAAAGMARELGTGSSPSGSIKPVPALKEFDDPGPAPASAPPRSPAPSNLSGRLVL